MANERNGTVAFTDTNDETVRKDNILNNRDKATKRPDDSLDSAGVQVDEYKEIQTNKRPKKDDEKVSGEAKKKVDRPGFDLGGASGDTEAGKGLGLGKDAKEGRKDWGLPR